MRNDMPVKVPRNKKVKAKVSRATYDLTYIHSKMNHIRTVLGQEACYGPHGGACTKAHMDEWEERRKKGKVKVHASS